MKGWFYNLSIKYILIGSVTIFLLIGTAGYFMLANKASSKKVLSAHITNTPMPTYSPTPSITPTLIPTSVPRNHLNQRMVNNTQPTVTVTSISPSPTPSQNINSQNTTNIIIVTATPTPIPSPTPTPTGDPKNVWSASGNGCAQSSNDVPFNKPGQLKYQITPVQNVTSLLLQVTKNGGNTVFAQQSVSGSGSIAINDIGSYTVSLSPLSGAACPWVSLTVEYN